MRQLLEQSLEIKERHFGADHLESCLTIANLAMACGVAGETWSARSFSDRALRICASNLSPTRRLGVVLLRAAVVHYAMGEASKADDCTSRALQVLGEVLGPIACARVIALERTRTSRIWAVASRNDVVRWVEVAWAKDRFSTAQKHEKAKGFEEECASVCL